MKTSLLSQSQKMKLIHGAAIKRSLREVSPISIAVAYVGIDWSTYIDTSTLKEIILSPTIGSNPVAISQLVDKLGWENIYFLDNLHSKVYLGTAQAAVGSFNLTANGLSAAGLQEAGYLISEPDAIARLRDLLAEYKALATAAYPTKLTKSKRLTELRAIWDRAIKTGSIRNDSKSGDIGDYVSTPGDPDVYVCCTWGDLKYSAQVVSPSTISQSLSFLDTDEIKPDRWILCWAAKDDGYPSKHYDPYWLHIDEVLKDGAIDTKYTQIAIERNDRLFLNYPFELTPQTVEALRAVLSSGDFPELLGNKDPWSVNDTVARLPDFFEKVHQSMRSEISGVASDAEKPLPTMNEKELRQLFKARVEQATDLAVEKGYVKQTIRNMLRETHAVELAKKLVIAPDLKSGLIQLKKANALELSFECIMLEPLFLSLFSKKILEAAQWNLERVQKMAT